MDIGRGGGGINRVDCRNPVPKLADGLDALRPIQPGPDLPQILAGDLAGETPLITAGHAGFYPRGITRRGRQQRAQGRLAAQVVGAWGDGDAQGQSATQPGGIGPPAAAHRAGKIDAIAREDSPGDGYELRHRFCLAAVIGGNLGHGISSSGGSIDYSKALKTQNSK